MLGAISMLLLAAVTVGANDAPPESGAGADAASPPPPACPSEIPDVAPQNPRPHRRIIVDELLAPGVPEEEEAPSGWIQASHEAFERGINALVLDLDRFFGDAAHEPYQPPTSHIRLRTEVRASQGGSVDTGVSVAGYLRLPAAHRMLARVRLFFVGETDPRPLPVPGPDVDLTPPRFRTTVGSGRGGLELRVDLVRARLTILDVGAGVRFGMPPPGFTRAHLAQAFPLGISVVGHLSQSLFWDQREGFGEASRLDVERAFGVRTLVRWWSMGNVDEVSRGFEWASELGLQRVLGARTGLYTAAAIAGATRSPAHVDRYRIYSRLRRDVYAGWAFVELEPDVEWTVDEVTLHRSPFVGATLRLELQFSSDGRRPTPLPPFRTSERRAHEAAPASAAW